MLFSFSDMARSRQPLEDGIAAISQQRSVGFQFLETTTTTTSWRDVGGAFKRSVKWRKQQQQQQPSVVMSTNSQVTHPPFFQGAQGISQPKPVDWDW